MKYNFIIIAALITCMSSQGSDQCLPCSKSPEKNNTIAHRLALEASDAGYAERVILASDNPARHARATRRRSLAAPADLDQLAAQQSKPLAHRIKQAAQTARPQQPRSPEIHNSPETTGTQEVYGIPSPLVRPQYRRTFDDPRYVGDNTTGHATLTEEEIKKNRAALPEARRNSLLAFMQSVDNKQQKTKPKREKKQVTSDAKKQNVIDGDQATVERLKRLDLERTVQIESLAAQAAQRRKSTTIQSPTETTPTSPMTTVERTTIPTDAELAQSYLQPTSPQSQSSSSSIASPSREALIHQKRFKHGGNNPNRSFDDATLEATAHQAAADLEEILHSQQS